MRYSPDGRYIVMDVQQKRIEVADAATGAVVATFPVGYEPRWIDDSHIIAQHPTGGSDTHTAGGWTLQRIPANRGQVDASGQHIWAVSDLRTTTYHDRLGTLITPNAREPRVSVAGELAVRHPDTGILRISADIELGLCEDSRWSDETLVWWLSGRVWGRSTPDAQTVELTVPGRSCSHPVPHWTGSELYVAMVIDDGELWLAEWGSLVRKEGIGWRVGQSDGSAFDWCVANA